MKEIFAAIMRFVKDRFNLDEDKAEEQEIVTNIQRDVHFKGTNLWTLIFAIMIASIGLNVNSTAVIIGAMLISPIMGPIMGVGLGIGTNDFDLVKKGIKNLAIAAVISILTSAIYFYISPIHIANSELLARTNPSLWDVFIAFFGGLAGIVAGTRTQKSTVIPGVAIATALMPPLCTAGFGLATGSWFYLLGALYLFFINSLFICLATFLIVRKLRFHKKQFETKAIRTKVLRYIWLSVTITVLPSIYLAYRIVERTIFEANGRNFIQREFGFARTQIISSNFLMDGTRKTIELLAVGEELLPPVIDTLKTKMPAYGLSNCGLIVRQGLDAKQEIDIAQIRASILEDVFQQQKLQDTLPVAVNKMDTRFPDLRSELRALYPDMSQYSVTHTIVYTVDSLRSDTLAIFVAGFRKKLPRTEYNRLEGWLKQRLQADSVKLLIE